MSPCFPTVNTVKGLTADCGLSDSLWFPSISIRYSCVYIGVCVCVTGRKKDRDSQKITRARHFSVVPCDSDVLWTASSVTNGRVNVRTLGHPPHHRDHSSVSPFVLLLRFLFFFFLAPTHQITQSTKALIYLTSLRVLMFLTHCKTPMWFWEILPLNFVLFCSAIPTATTLQEQSLLADCQFVQRLQ